MAIIQNKPNMNYGVWGSNGNIAVPTSEKVDLGWIIEKPPNEVMNWVQNRQDSMLQFINQRGIPTWDSFTEYPLNAYVVRSGTLYRAISQNIDKDPTLNFAIWNVAFATYTDYSNLYNEVQSIKDVEGYLDLYVSKNNPVMIGEAKGVGYKDSTGVSGLNFSGTTPQIVNNNVTAAIFQQITNLTESSKKVVTMDVLLQVLQIYKVGDLYLTTNSSNPATTLGYGVWESYAEGRALVGYNGRNSLTPDWTRVPNNMFGEYSVALSEENNGEHEHKFSKNATYSTIDQAPNKTISFLAGDPSGVTTHGGDDILESANYLKTSGKGVPHNNVQPSIIVFIWRRTA